MFPKLGAEFEKNEPQEEVAERSKIDKSIGKTNVHRGLRGAAA